MVVAGVEPAPFREGLDCQSGVSATPPHQYKPASLRVIDTHSRTGGWRPHMRSRNDLTRVAASSSDLLVASGSRQHRSLSAASLSALAKILCTAISATWSGDSV